MPSRTGTSRSHNGCAQCKSHRVKCDETLPACRRCVRNGRICSFSAIVFGPASTLAVTAAAETSRPTTSQRQFQWRAVDTPRVAPLHNRSPSVHSDLGSVSTGTITSPVDYDGSTLTSRSTSARIQSPVTSKSESSPISSTGYQTPSTTEAQELEYFVAIVARSITEDSSILPLFQVTAPALAVDRPYLRYCLLAISAHHRLAHDFSIDVNLRSTTPASALKERTADYQVRALSLYMPQMQAASTPDDCIAAALASILFLLFSFASRQLSVSVPGPPASWAAVDKVVEILKLKTGTRALMHSNWAVIASSALRPVLFADPRRSTDAPLDEETQSALEDLKRVCTTDAIPSNEQHVYLQAIEGLTSTFYGIARDPHHLGYRLSWVKGELASSLADLASARKPETLILFSHWAATLCDWPGAWWEMGLGQALIREAYEGVPESYHKYFRWPLRRIGEP